MKSEPVRYLEKLIRLPSVHPDHTREPAHAGEARVAAFIADALGSKGYAIAFVTDPDRPDRPNVLASLGPDDARYTLMLEGHMDTVGVEGFEGDPFKPVEKEGLIHGRGACDDKGPIAAALTALRGPEARALVEAGGRILFVGAMGEEKGNEGALELVRQGVRADEALVLEPTDLQVVCAHKGALWLRATLHGRAAHGSHPERGLNAIAAAATFIRQAVALTEEQRKRIVHDLLGGPTLNIGRIEGGMAPNIVPDLCTVDLDRRVLPGEDPEAVAASYAECLEGMREKGEIKGYTLKPLSSGAPFQTPTDSPLVSRLIEACSDAGRRAETTGASWFSDAGPLSAVCGRIAVFGPGSIRLAHAVNEHIPIAELETAAMALRAFLKRTAQTLKRGER